MIYCILGISKYLLRCDYVLRSTIFFYLSLFNATISQGRLSFKCDHVSRGYGKWKVSVHITKRFTLKNGVDLELGSICSELLRTITVT